MKSILVSFIVLVLIAWLGAWAWFFWQSEKTTPVAEERITKTVPKLEDRKVETSDFCLKNPKLCKG